MPVAPPPGPVPPGPSAPPVAAPHSTAEDVLGVLTGTFVVSLGLLFLTTADAVTGGTAGLALLVTYALGVPFGVVFVVVNLPFFVLAALTKGRRFTARSAAAVILVSGFSALHAAAVELDGLSPLYGVLTGNLVIGIGMLIVFRHGSSLGGFNVLALLAQERLGWRAGLVQMALDVAVVVLALTVVSPADVATSALGAAVLNSVLALNHRPGRYLGA